MHNEYEIVVGVTARGRARVQQQGKRHHERPSKGRHVLVYAECLVARTRGVVVAGFGGTRIAHQGMGRWNRPGRSDRFEVRGEGKSRNCGLHN